GPAPQHQHHVVAAVAIFHRILAAVTGGATAVDLLVSGNTLHPRRRGRKTVVNIAAAVAKGDQLVDRDSQFRHAAATPS
ncbi:MAG: hypothetical protein KDI34_22935, partial [Halioglobus sp.]|nr:hypothetical protein [Halioglobus sp.]